MTKHDKIRKSGRRNVAMAVLTALFLPVLLYAQQPATDTLLQNPTLENVVQYAIAHRPAIQKSLIDEDITQSSVKSKLADWYPQVNFNYNIQNNITLQPTLFPSSNGVPGGVRQLGAPYTSFAQFIATQNIFNRDAFLAVKTAGEVKRLSKETTSSSKIDLSVSVTKAFYDVLATTQQIDIGKEDILRLEKSLQDAYNQFVAGVADKTDYKRATIALSNTKAMQKSNEELLKYKIEYLKSLMGYPVEKPLVIVYDTLQMENEIAFDTLQKADYKNRVDYRLLNTQKNIQAASVSYSKWSFLPNIYATGSYSFYYLDPELKNLYQAFYPVVYVGLTATVPILQGGKRWYNIKQEKSKLKKIDWDITNLKNTVSSEHAQAIAAYKGNLVNYLSLKDNMELAQEVYDIIQKQYKAGIKTYLDVITAETDLRTARINYYNALYQVLSSKIDLQKALGQINY